MHGLIFARTGTLRNILLLRKEKRLCFEDLHVELKEEEILGSFILLDESEHIKQGFIHAKINQCNDDITPHENPTE